MMKKNWLFIFALILIITMSACENSKVSSTKGKELKVSVGRQAWAAGNSPVIQYMMENKLFEKYATEFGYDLEVEYQDHPSAAPMVEAMIAGRLDFGMWGNTPIIRNLAANQEISVLNVGEGHLRYVLVTRDGNGVKKLEDLEGKTVGLLVGGDPHNAFNQMLRYHLGVSNPEELNIKLVNIAAFSQAAQVPKGIDATVTYLPALLKAIEEDPDIKPVANAFGYTEEFYDDGEIQGEGHLLDSVKDSPFFPDGYYLHRSMWVVNNKIVNNHPDIASAFVMAQEEAIQELEKLSSGEISQVVKEYWELSPELGGKVIDDEVLFLRGWSWPTEGDAWSMVETSKFMAEAGLIDNPLSWEDIMKNFENTAPILKKAYEKRDRYPEKEQFLDKTSDVRGLPVWEMDDWELPEK